MKIKLKIINKKKIIKIKKIKKIKKQKMKIKKKKKKIKKIKKYYLNQILIFLKTLNIVRILNS